MDFDFATLSERDALTAHNIANRASIAYAVAEFSQERQLATEYVRTRFLSRESFRNEYSEARSKRRKGTISRHGINFLDACAPYSDPLAQYWVNGGATCA